MSGWRDFRPAIWLAFLGIALVMLVSPPYLGAVLIGAAIGVALQVVRRRRAQAGPAAGRRRPRG